MMRFFFLLLLLGSSVFGWSQYQPWKNIEPGVHQFRGLFPPLRNAFLVEDGKDGFYLISTPYNSADQAAMINSIRTDFPGRKLKALIVVEQDYASAAGAFLVTSALGKVPVYAANNLVFTEEEKYIFLSKNPKNQEAGKFSVSLDLKPSFKTKYGEMTIKKIGTACGNPGIVVMIQPSGTLFCASSWIETPFPLTPSWTYSVMMADFHRVFDMNPSRIFGGLSSDAYPKFKVWEIRRNWEQWFVDYRYRKKEKMTASEFFQSMKQRGSQFPWVPNDEKSLEILWKFGWSAL